jgi:hypothetical protein
MTDEKILQEIERRLADWFATPGWSEENCGFYIVQGWIEELRAYEQGAKTNDRG